MTSCLVKVFRRRQREALIRAPMKENEEGFRGMCPEEANVIWGKTAKEFRGQSSTQRNNAILVLGPI